ncbi:MAG: hypothetical protein GQ574_25660 [Crocinitomix sp.]|nr:hypothetical protein [Crocinitomix sp.]
MPDNFRKKKVIELILAQKKLQSLSWNELASNLPISGDSLRIAFAREKVKLSHLITTCGILGIENHNLANTENLEILNKNALASKYVSVPFINRYSYKNYYTNMGDIYALNSLPRISWYAENLSSMVASDFLSLEVKNQCMNDGSIQSLIKFDLLLLQKISKEALISEAFENSKTNFVIMHNSPDIGIQICKIVFETNGKPCNYVSFLNNECERFRLILNDISHCYKVIRLIRNSTL